MQADNIELVQIVKDVRETREAMIAARTVEAAAKNAAFAANEAHVNALMKFLTAANQVEAALNRPVLG